MMASWGSCDFRDFRAMSERFRAAADRLAYDRFLRETVLELGNMLLGGVKERTPVDTGALRRTWFLSGVRQRGDVYEVELYNNTEYAPWVENGHRIVRSGGTVGWCEGFFMLRLSVLELERVAPEVLGARTEAFLRALMEGGR